MNETRNKSPFTFEANKFLVPIEGFLGDENNFNGFLFLLHPAYRAPIIG